jgi:O-antigen/teichoic acid export membrane protein
MIKQALHLTIGNLVSRCVFALLTIVLAKIVSPESYGAFSYAVAVTTISSYFCELGIQNTYLRDVSGGKLLWECYTITSLYIRAILYAPVCLIAYLLLPHLINSVASLRCIELMFAPGVLGLTLTNWITGALLSQSKIELLARTRIRAAVVQVALVGVGVFIPVSSNYRIEAVALGYGAGLLAGGCFGIRAIPLQKITISGRRFRYFAGRLLRGLHGYVVSGFFYMLAPSVGVLVLERSAALAVVGTFSLAARIPQFMYTIPGAAGQSFYPKLFETFRNNDWKSYEKLFLKEARLLLLIGICLALAIFVSAPVISIVVGHSRSAIYQAEFKQALLIGAGIIFIQSLSIPLGHTLETTGRAGYRTLGQGLALGVAILLFVILGRRFGTVGAMAAAVITEGVLYCAWMILLFISGRRTHMLQLLMPSVAGTLFVLIFGAVMWRLYI